MKKLDIYTLALLIVLTIGSVFMADTKHLSSIVLGLAAVKFSLIAFQFVGVKYAHAFWKFSILFYCIVVFGIIYILNGHSVL